MKRILTASLVVAFSSAACAPHVWTRDQIEGRMVCDPDRMEATERAARLDGTDVHWVNCPRATLRVVSAEPNGATKN